MALSGLTGLSGLSSIVGGAGGGGGGVDSPDDIGGLLAWWKTESLVSPSNGNPITSWPDASGNGRTATPNSVGCFYRASAINGRAAIEFQGDYAPFTSANLGTLHTVFVVFKPITGFGDGVILGGSATGRYCPYLDGTDIYYRALLSEAFVSVAHGGLTTNTAYLLGIVRSGTNVSFYKNGSLLGSPQTLAANTALTVVQLSGLAGSPFELQNCQIAEVVVYDSALSTGDRQAIESYLNGRFALY